MASSLVASVPAPVVIVGVSITCILVAEVLTWLLINRTSSFKRLVADIDRTSKELERVTSGATASATAAQKKREKTLETQITYMTRDFYFFRMRQYGVMAVFMGGMFYTLRGWYAGQSVAVLPFAPMFPFSRFAQQFLEKPGPNDCSFLFLYVLCNLGVRPNVARALGTALPPSVARATDMGTMTQRFQKLAMGRGQ